NDEIETSAYLQDQLRPKPCLISIPSINSCSSETKIYKKEKKDSSNAEKKEMTKL
ncbi:37926_t:CDS:1, partial [Gigaspora margarita]